MKGRPADPRSPHKVCTNMGGFANPTNGDLPQCQGQPLLSKIELPRRGRRNETEDGVQLHFLDHDGMLVVLQV